MKMYFHVFPILKKWGMFHPVMLVWFAEKNINNLDHHLDQPELEKPTAFWWLRLDLLEGDLTIAIRVQNIEGLLLFLHLEFRVDDEVNDEEKNDEPF